MCGQNICVFITLFVRNDQKVGNLGVGKLFLYVLDNLVNNIVFYLDILLLEVQDYNIVYDKGVILLCRSKIYQNLQFRIYFVILF